MQDVSSLDAFTRAYIVAALWSSTDGDGTPLDDEKYSDAELAPETLEKIKQDCAKFQADNAALLADFPSTGEYTGLERAGHDFWLTRNGHGAGFWDRGLGQLGDKLTMAAKRFPECDLYVGDDGTLYLM